MAYRDTIRADNPKAYLEFENNLTNTGISPVGTFPGSPTYVAGYVNQGVSYAGATKTQTSGNSSNAYGTVGTSTIECWVKTTSTNNSVILMAGSLGAGAYTSFYLTGSTGRVSFRMASSTIEYATAINNGQWHHLVGVRTGGTSYLYVDGVERANTFITDTSSMPGTLTIAANSDGAEFFTGSLDEVAAYPTALTAAKVTTHYNAGLNSQVVNAGYTAQVSTATALAVGPTISTVSNRTYDAQVMTANATAPDSTVVISKTCAAQAMTASAMASEALNKPRTERSTTSADASIFADAATTVFNSDVARIQTDTVAGDDALLFKIVNPLPAEFLTSVKIKFKAQANSTGTFTPKVYLVTGAWSESTVTYASAPAMTFFQNLPAVTLVAGNTWEVDLTEAYRAGYTNGFAITTSTIGAAYLYTKEAVSSTNRPVVEFMFGDEEIPKTVSATPMTASASITTPNVVADKDLSVLAEPAQAQAEMPGGYFATPLVINASPAEATASAVDAVVSTQRGPKINVGAMTATIVWKQPEAVNGSAIIADESEDAYFQRVIYLGPESWWRLNDKTSTVTDRVGGDANGTYLSVVYGQHDAPESRASAFFDGDGFIQGGPLELSAVPGTLEFGFRTTGANSFLMLSADDRVSPTATVDEPNREIYLSNGRITFKTYFFQNSLGGQPEPVTFSGSRNLADGIWHHIVVRPFSGYNGTGTEIWVDGKFEVRRYGAGSWNGMPDYTGGRPGIPTSQYLIGDMSEIVFYEKAISTDDITRNYYAFMGWSPVFAQPAEATASMGAARAKGNQKKALYLYWDKRSEWEKGGTAAEATTFDPMTDFVYQGGQSEPVGDYHGFKVFAKGITAKGDASAYRDPYTDENSIVNLDTDVDLADYDVIMFKDWPDEGPELDEIESAYPGAKERLLGQIREANDKGIGLYVTNPRLAIDLGVIDRVEFVPTLVESRAVSGQGAARGLYDYGSAVKFPWNITLSDGLIAGQYAAGIGQPENLDPAYLASKAFYYHDTNKNDRFRVRALVDDLTDISSYMIEDAVFHVDYDPWGWQGAAFKYLKREDGLQIGDEYMFNGAEITAARYEDAVDRRYNRYNGTWATPAGHVLAGTVVTTFGSKHWNGATEVDNPYKDYATTIVLEPGDNLAGRPVGGKVFINFTEQPSRGLGVAVQVLPEAGNNVQWPFQYAPETAAQREWDFSWTRATLRTTGTTSTSVVTVTLPTGETASIPLSGSADELSMVRSNQLFPVVGKPRWEMDGRGMFWLSVKPEVNEGDVTVRTTALTATAAAVQPVIVAQKDAHAKATPMAALAMAPKVSEDTSGDAEIHTLPLTAEATMTGYGKTIAAEPMIANAELVENFDLVHATGEQVVLYLHGVDVTLFIKEEA